MEVRCMEETATKKLLSPSRINCMLLCPMKHHLKYVLKVKELPPPEYFEFGSKLHEVIKNYYLNIPESITPKEVPLFVSQAVKKVDTDVNDKLLQHLRGFTQFEEVRLTWNIGTKPLAIEKKIERGPFQGIIDAMFKKGEEIVVVDWKSGYGWNPILDDGLQVQGEIYRYLTNADRIFFIFVKYNKWVELPKERNSAIISKIKSAIENIRKGVKDRNKGWHCENCEVSLFCSFLERGWNLWNL